MLNTIEYKIEIRVGNRLVIWSHSVSNVVVKWTNSLCI